MSKTTDHKELPGPWAKTYAAKSKGDMLEAYSEWSSTYDEDSVKKFGYIAPLRSAQVLSEHLSRQGLSKDALIADIGAGTGLVGEHLFEMGYSNGVALDYSDEMLRIAKAKSCYRDLYCVDLHDSLEKIEAATGLGPGSFDAAVSVGTFTPHHVGIEALLIVIKLIRSGGILSLSLRDDFVEDTSNGFLAKLNELEASGTIKRLDVTESELYTPKVSQTIFFRCWTYTIA